jgi:hypothetical protein
MVYSTEQVAKKIGVKPQVLEEWMLHGFKAPRKRNISGVFVRLWEESDVERAREFSLSQPKRTRRQDKPRAAGIRVFTSAEVAKQLEVSKMTLMRWVSSGRVRKPKLFILSRAGIAWLWSKKEVTSLSSMRNALLDPRGQRPKTRTHESQFQVE